MNTSRIFHNNPDGRDNYEAAVKNAGAAGSVTIFLGKDRQTIGIRFGTESTTRVFTKAHVKELISALQEALNDL